MQKENATHFSCQDKPTYNRSSGSGCVALTSGSGSENAYDNGITGNSSGRQGSYSNPVATKPAGWTGQWHEPQANPLKLTDTNCKTLSKQGRCWSCRGSGHHRADSVCLNKKKQDEDGKKRLNAMREENATREGHISLEELEKE